LSELKQVALSSLYSNPHRDPKVFPLREDRVEKIKASIEAEGFWEGVIARPAKDGYEIAFGHHRVEAAKRALGAKERVPIIVRDLDDSEMLRFMERENIADGLGFYYTTVQVVRATVLAFAAGSIKLDAVSKDTRDDTVRTAPSFQRGRGTETGATYTAETVAKALGRIRGKDGKADQDILTALATLEGMETGILKREDVDLDVQSHVDTVATVAWTAERAARVKEAEAAVKVKVLEEAKAVATKNEDMNKVKTLDIEIQRVEAQVNAPAKAAKAAVHQAVQMFKDKKSVREVHEQVVAPLRQVIKDAAKKQQKKAAKVVNGWDAAAFETAISAAETARRKYEEWTEGASEGAAEWPKKAKDYIAVNERLIAQIEKMNKALRGAK